MRLSREQSSLGAMLLNMAWPIAATVAGLLLLAAGLSVRLARQITQPINAIPRMILRMCIRSCSP